MNRDEHKTRDTTRIDAFCALLDRAVTGAPAALLVPHSGDG